MTRDLLIEKWNPTIIKEGSAYWLNSKYEAHRTGDQPAIVFPSGTIYWFRNGVPHRGGGKPAAILSNGEMYWYKDGVKYFPEKQMT